jgi:predicted XRE-type DNA-binding protein
MSMRKKAIRHTTPVIGSVFLNLGFDAAEARVLQMRADLMAALREHIEEEGWTQRRAAKELMITQPRVSSLVKGAWRDFSADMLLVLAARAGLKPTLGLAALRSDEPDFAEAVESTRGYVRRHRNALREHAKK